jgi:hypothetical protein
VNTTGKGSTKLDPKKKFKYTETNYIQINITEMNFIGIHNNKVAL